ncbi:MAG TPA: enoyl-CoA hydratase/isomerase family protein [Casimicrobiaceae bacterium]|nr:enoyl-CoA hydratase/isomerase family protein [Casimicrobiaceae bacterium]
MTRPVADGPPTLEVGGAAATIRLCRPAEHNRIDPDDVAVIRGYLDSAKLYPSARALVFTGAGETTFSSGYTVDAIVGRLDRDFEELLDAIERLPLPTICALNGSVYGGATDLALCCDFRLGVRGSRMFMPAAKFGLHYYPGGLRRAVAALGATQAKRIFLTAQAIDAEEMLRIGFLTELLDRRELAARVDAYVAALAECEPGVVRSMKRQIDAIAAGDRTESESRAPYEASLASEELRRRLAPAGRQR